MVRGAPCFFFKDASNQRIHQHNNQKIQKINSCFFSPRVLSSPRVNAKHPHRGQGPWVGLPFSHRPEGISLSAGWWSCVTQVFLPACGPVLRAVRVCSDFGAFLLLNLSIFLTLRCCCERNWSCYALRFDTVYKRQGGRQQTTHSMPAISLKGPRGRLSVSQRPFFLRRLRVILLEHQGYDCLWGEL